MGDLISRQAVLDYIDNMPSELTADGRRMIRRIRLTEHIRDSLPSAQTEIKPIDYRDCVNAMLRMWIDNVVTDGEYDRIMNKLHAHWGMKNG